MKVLIATIILLTVFTFALFIWAKFLPTEHEVTVQKTINAPAEKVWSIMTAWEQQIKWRDDIQKIEIIDKDNFVEQPKKGSPIRFTIIEQKPSSFLKLTMSGSFEGSYIVKLKEKDEATVVTAQEKIVQKSLVGRLLMKLFFDLEAFANNYINNSAASEPSFKTNQAGSTTLLSSHIL